MRKMYIYMYGHVSFEINVLFINIFYNYIFYILLILIIIELLWYFIVSTLMQLKIYLFYCN